MSRKRRPEIAPALLDQTLLSVPAVSERRVLLDAVARDDWWQDIALPHARTMRKRPRGLVAFVPVIRPADLLGEHV